MRKIFKLASMQKKSIHVCPNGCDSRQETVVSVLQPWSVDAEGQLLERHPLQGLLGQPYDFLYPEQ